MEQPFARRGKRADEMLDVLRKLWAGGWVEHHGDFYDFDEVEVTPAPGHVPVYVGGLSEAALKRAARNDGWISDLHTMAELEEIVGRVRSYRDPAAGDIDVLASCRDAWDLDGYRRLHEAGVTHLITMPWYFYAGADADLQQKVDGIRRFADDVIAKW